MQTFLQLCKDVRQEAGIQGEGPVSVVGRKGIEKRLVDWVKNAWLDIQRLRNDWLFLQTDFSFDTVAGVSKYSLASTTGLTGLSAIYPDLVTAYLLSDGKAKEYRLSYVDDYNVWRSRYEVGEASQGKPSAFCLSPDNALLINPPDGIYRISGTGRRVTQILANNDDVILLDDEYIAAIKWKAIAKFATDQEAESLRFHAVDNYKDILIRMEMEQLPQIRAYVRPLA